MFSTQKHGRDLGVLCTKTDCLTDRPSFVLCLSSKGLAIVRMWEFDIRNKRTREFLQNEVSFAEGLQHPLKTTF